MPRTSHLKRFARLMSFIWLFSLAVSTANACILSASRAATSLAAHVAASPALAAPGAIAAHDIGQEPGACPAACKSFCDSERSTVAKTKNAEAPDLSDMAPCPVATRAWRLRVAPCADEEAAWWLAAAPPRQLAPAIQYLRLTL